jgi:hypothetical protein
MNSKSKKNDTGLRVLEILKMLIKVTREAINNINNKPYMASLPGRCVGLKIF